MVPVANGANSPIKADHAWFTGEDQAIRFTIYDAAGAVQNITGWTLSFKLATAQTAAASVTKAATLTTPLSGIATVAVAAADTSGLTPATYFYTLARTDSGFNSVVAYGSAVLQGRPS